MSNGNELGRAPETHRVLVVSANMGAGHDATAAALEEQVRLRWPGSAIRRVDALDLMGVGAAFRAIYVHNVEHTPWLYEFFYSSLWRHRWFAAASKRFTGSWCGRRLVSVLNEFDPDLILSTYPLGSSGLAWLRRHRGLTVPAGAWVSDFAPHPFWVYRDLDLTVVLHETAATTARAAEPAAHVVVGPLPVVRAFSPAPADEGSSPWCRILVSCGSYSFGDTARLVRSLLAASANVHVVAVCGRNATVHQRLTGLGYGGDRLQVLGWVDDMPALLRNADLVLTNAGGATALEALASGVPVVMYEPIAAHGKANAELMVTSGLADLVEDPDRLPDYIRATAADPQSRQELRARIHRHLQQTDLADGLGLLAALAEAPVGAARAASRPWPLRPADALFAAVDTEHVRQELGVVCELDPRPGGAPPTLESIRAELAERSRGIPTLHRRLATGRRRGWLLEPRIVIDRHVRDVELPCSAGTSADWTTDALAAAGRFWAEPLPTDRPAWQVLLIRTASEPTGGEPDRSSCHPPLVAFKIHHAVADGISALTVLDALLGSPPPAVPASSAPKPARWGTAPTVARGLLSLAAQGRAPRVPLSRGPGPGRQITGWTLPVAALRHQAAAYSAGPHELMLTLTAEALGRLFRPGNLVVPGSTLRVMVPVALRSTRLNRFFGNWTGALAADLPVEPMPFGTRLVRVREELRRRGARGEPQAAQLVLRLAGRLPRPVFDAAARVAYSSRFFHTVVSYLPGPRSPRSLAGARVRTMFPVLPLAPGIPVTVGAVSYGPTLCVGVTLDPELGCDAAAVHRAFDDAWAAASGQPMPQPTLVAAS